jgi:hypothetical protein
MTVSRHHLINACAFLISLLALATMLATPSRAAPAATSAKAEFAKAVESFRAAMVRGDGKALTALAAPGLSFGHSNGLVQTREQFVKSVVSKQEIFKSIKLREKRQIVNGATGISRHVFDADILYEGKPLKVKLACLEVWHKINGKWQLVARQAFKKANPV